MASKRRHKDSRRYAEVSSSDEDKDQDVEYEAEREQQQQRAQTAGRSGRPRKVSSNSQGAVLVGAPTIVKQEMTPIQEAAITANLLDAGAVKRRGRGPSKKVPLNKNALSARVNRERKKVYLKNIEDKLNDYHETNKKLSSIIQQQNKQLQDLSSQVNYYQSLIANQYEITALLVGLNEALKALHGSKDTITSTLSTKVANALKRVNQNVDKFKWSASHEEITSNSNIQSAPSLNILNSNKSQDELEGAAGGRQQSLSFGQVMSPKIIRKTTSRTGSISDRSLKLSTKPTTEDPSSVESLFMDDNDRNKFQESSESHFYCEHNIMDTSSVGTSISSNNQMPTTPVSEVMSNSMDVADGSLLDTNFDFEALNNINVDNLIFNNIEKTMSSPIDRQPDDQCNLLDEFFKSVNDKDQKHPTDEIDILLNIDETSRFNRTLFNTLNPPMGQQLSMGDKMWQLENFKVKGWHFLLQ